MLTVKRQSHHVSLALGSMICPEEITVIVGRLSAPLGRVVQARGGIVERYVHGAGGEIKLFGEEGSVGRVVVTRFRDLGVPSGLPVRNSERSGRVGRP